MGSKNKKHQPTGHHKFNKQSQNADNTLNKQERESSSVSDVAGAFLLGLLSLLLYVYTLYPSIHGGDSGELITAAQELGVAHPPGYPLFTILAWLSIHVVPVGSIAWRVNLLTAVLSSLAAFFFALTIYRITSSLGSAILGVCFWCFSKLTWTWSITAEVFGMNNLFTAVLLYLMTCFQDAEETQKTKLSTIGAFICALSLCNQHTMVLYVVVIATWVLLDIWSAKLLSVKLLGKITLCFLLGLTPYFYLPLSAHYSKGSWTWGDQRTPEGFITHVLRQEYGTFNLGKEGESAGLIYGLSAYGSHCLEEFTVFGVILLVIGLFSTYRRCFHQFTQCLTVMMTMVSLYLLFFSWRANLDITNPLLLGVVERFWMQSDCIVVLFICLGYSALIRFIQSFITNIDLRSVAIIIALALAGYHVQTNFASCNQRNNTVVHEFGSRLLENMPRNALVLTKGDLPSNTLRYLYLCENMRPDLKLFDQEVLTYEWSVQMMKPAYPRIVFPGHHMYSRTGRLPDGTQVFNFQTFLDANYDSSTIVACIGVQEHDDSWQQSFTTFPFGPCQLVVKPDRFNMEEWIKLSQNMSAGWKYPFNGFEATSWERVASDEMWQAQISVAFALYNYAVNTKPIEQKSKIMLRSYQLYASAISEHPIEEIPAYWHKNFALVCHRLLSLQHGLPQTELLDKAILHYERFIKMDPDDENYDAIVKAVKQMKVQRGNQQ